jgi:NAD(P)H-dependent FMN reductase
MAPGRRCCIGVDRRIRTVVLLVGASTSPRRSSRVLRWLRVLLPTALLIVSSAPLPSGDEDDVITLDVDDVADAGPLSLAAALTRESGG